MNLSDVMDQISAQVDTIAGLRCFAYPPDTIQPPAAVVDYPETYTFDETFVRGSDRMTLPLWVVTARVQDRTARELLTAYLDGSGSSSIKAVVEAGTYTAFHTVRVVDCEIEVVDIGGTNYWSAKFNLDIFGRGT